MELNLAYDTIFVPCFEGESTSGTADGTQGTADGTQAGTQNNNQGTQNQNQGINRTFTQEEVNKFLAEDRKKGQEKTQKLITELETLKKSKNLTEQEKATLQSRIEELNTQVMSKEQLLEKEKSKMTQEHQTQLQQERNEKELWRNRYNESTIVRSITDGAAKHEAFSPDQIIALLQPRTRLVEEVDGEGKGQGTFTPRVKFQDTDNDGKPTILDLSIEEAIKRMKELPEKYGNLFKSNLAGGLGGTGGVGGAVKKDLSQIKTIEDYKKHRGKILKRS